MDSTEPVNYFGLFRTAEGGERYEAGGVVFAAGDEADVLYVVREGEVALTSGDTTLEVLGEGGMFGEMALVDRTPRSATAVARTACEVVPVSRERFRAMVQETPFFAESVMRVMADRLRRVTGTA